MDRLTTPFSSVSLPGRVLQDPVGFSNHKGISRSGNYSLSANPGEPGENPCPSGGMGVYVTSLIP